MSSRSSTGRLPTPSGTTSSRCRARGSLTQEQAREVVEDYVEARNEDDFDRVCELFSEDFNRQLGKQFDLSGGGDCAAGVQVASEASGLGAGTQEFRVIDVRVREERAVADFDVVSDQEGPSRIAPEPQPLGLVLERQDDERKITEV